MNYENLTEGQKNAFDAAVEAVGKKGAGQVPHLTINGPAGTGKTTLTKCLLDYFTHKGVHGVFLAAPTHQAKKVLSKLAGQEASTIHSLLKINPSNYEDKTVFEQRDTPELDDCQVLFCDEASMYDTELFRLILTSVPRHCTIIALGDVAQIRPVSPGSGENNVSPFFINDKFKQVSLTEVKRSNAPIIEVATQIRTGGWIENNVQNGQGVFDLSGTESLRNFFGKYFEIVQKPDDLFENRMLAYTNKSVENLNGIIRKQLYKTQDMFIDGEVVVMQEPLVKTVEYQGKKFTEIVFNNGEQVRILNCKLTSDMFQVKGAPGSTLIRYWELDLEAVDPNVDGSKNEGTIKVLANQEESDKLGYMLGKAADSYRNGPSVKGQWAGWWRLKRTFLTVKALPCSTVHKSQGISVDNCFLYTPCIHKADIDLARQLLYVGTTRARHNVYFI